MLVCESSPRAAPSLASEVLDETEALFGAQLRKQTDLWRRAQRSPTPGTHAGPHNQERHPSSHSQSGQM